MTHSKRQENKTDAPKIQEKLAVSREHLAKELDIVTDILSQTLRQAKKELEDVFQMAYIRKSI